MLTTECVHFEWFAVRLIIIEWQNATRWLPELQRASIVSKQTPAIIARGNDISYRPLGFSLCIVGYRWFGLKVADEESKFIPHEFPRFRAKNATFWCVSDNEHSAAWHIERASKHTALCLDSVFHWNTCAYKDFDSCAKSEACLVVRSVYRRSSRTNWTASKFGSGTHVLTTLMDNFDKLAQEIAKYHFKLAFGVQTVKQWQLPLTLEP